VGADLVYFGNRNPKHPQYFNFYKMKSNIISVVFLACLVAVLILSACFLGGYGVLAVSLLIAVGIADSTNEPNDQGERVNE
jgi:nitrate reductase NapE component